MQEGYRKEHGGFYAVEAISIGGRTSTFSASAAARRLADDRVLWTETQSGEWPGDAVFRAGYVAA